MFFDQQATMFDGVLSFPDISSAAYNAVPRQNPIDTQKQATASNAGRNIAITGSVGKQSGANPQFRE